MSDKIINNSDDFRISVKFLSYNKISAISCVLYFLFLHFLFNLGKHDNKYEKILFYEYMKLV